VNGWIFLALGVGIALSDFLIGLAWTRKAPDRLAAGPSAEAAAAARGRLGRILMLSGPIVFIVFAAIAFGALPVSGVEPIAFN
jgi:hypothetical protein